ncbi:MAG: hypothetical protein WBN09_14530 [Woeseiaceae bacterium]
MAFESTITEHDMDAKTKAYAQGMRSERQDFEPDLAVDGLTDSVLSRLLGLFGIGRH